MKKKKKKYIYTSIQKINSTLESTIYIEYRARLFWCAYYNQTRSTSVWYGIAKNVFFNEFFLFVASHHTRDDCRCRWEREKSGHLVNEHSWIFSEGFGMGYSPHAHVILPSVLSSPHPGTKYTKCIYTYILYRECER